MLTAVGIAVAAVGVLLFRAAIHRFDAVSAELLDERFPLPVPGRWEGSE